VRRVLILIIISSYLYACTTQEAVKGEFNPEESFKRANSLLEEKKYEDARKLLNEIKSRDFGGTYGPLAALRIGDSYLMEDEIDLAIDEFRRFIDSYPAHKFASYAQHKIAMAYFKQIEDIERGYASAEKALKEFQTLMELYPRNPYAEEAVEKIENLKTLRADYEFMVGDFYFKKAAYKGAIGRLKPLLEEFPNYKKEPEVLLRLIISYKRLGLTEKSDEYLKILSEKYPKSKAVEEVNKALTK